MKISLWDLTRANKKRPNKPTLLACNSCKLRKVRCITSEFGSACHNCKKRNEHCTYNSSRLETLKVPKVVTPAPEKKPHSPIRHVLQLCSSDTVEVHGIFSPRQAELLPGELQILVDFFDLINEPHKSVMKQLLPSLVKKATTTEFRFLIDTLLSAVKVHKDRAKSPSTPDSGHCKSSPVDLISQVNHTKGSVLMLPIFSVLDVFQIWSKPKSDSQS